MKRLLFLLALLGAAIAAGQAVNCTINFNFTAAGQATGTTGCGSNSAGVIDWRMVYVNNTFNPVSIVVESAPDNNGAPGAWVTFTGTTIEGPNPATNIVQGTVRVAGYNRWVRVRAGTLTGGPGNVAGVLYGCLEPGCGGTGASGTVPVVVTGQPIGVAGAAVTGADGVANTGQAQLGGPLEVVPSNFNGATWDRQFVCPLQASFTLSAATDSTIITGVASTNVRICHISFSGPTPSDVTIRQGTGTTCLTNTVPLTGAYGSVASLALDFQPTAALRTTVAARDVCLHTSAAVTLGGVVIYAQF